VGKKCRRRKRRFCRSMKRAVCHLAKAVGALRCARERTGSVWVEEELTDEIATLRDVGRRLARLRRKRCARSLCCGW